MKDIRGFIVEDAMYVYDKAKVKAGEAISIFAVSKLSYGKYHTVSTEAVVEDGDIDTIEGRLVELVNNQGVGEDMELNTLKSSLTNRVGVEANSCDNIILAIPSTTKVSKVDMIMQEILSLDYKDRARIVVRVLDLL